MHKTELEDIIDFVKKWDNEDKVEEDGTKPVNEYNLAALMAGMGFTLKWYVREEDFFQIADELDYNLKEGETRLLLDIGEHIVEIELDNAGVLDKVEEDTEDIRNTLANELSKIAEEE